MKRIVFIALTLLLASPAVFAQQNLQQSQFFNNLQSVNPAYSGWKNNIEIRSGYRKQWAAFNNAPESYFMAFHIPINNPDEPRFTNYSLRMSNPELYKEMVNDYLEAKTKIKYGIGGYLVSDNQALYNKTTAALTYSVHYGIANKYHLSAGVSTGFNRFGFNYEKIDVAFDVEQDQLFQDFINRPNANMSFDLSAGLLFYGKNFHISYSAAQLLPNKQLSTDGVKESRMQHIATGGIKVPLTSSILLEPTFMVKADGLNVNYLGNVIARYRQFWGGLGYGDNKQMAFLLGMKVSKLIHVGYSYDYSFTEIKNYNQGSHEFIIGLDIPRFPASILNAVR